MLKEKFIEEAMFKNQGLVVPIGEVLATKPPAKVKDDFNSVSFLTERLHGNFWRCSLSRKVFLCENNSELDEEASNTLCLNLKKEAPIKTEDFWMYLNSKYIEERNVIQGFFEGLPTPDTDTMDLYFSCLRLTNQGHYEKLKSIFCKWLIGTIAQVMGKPFFPNIICPVLMGAINLGKTSFFKRLTFENELKPYITVQSLSGTKLDKETQSLFSQYLLICLDDLDRSDFKKSSAFRTLISTDSFSFRPVFARNYVNRARVGSLCGTTNEKDIISDAQNNRRIVPIEIESIDFELLNSVGPDEVWASAYEAYSAGEDWTLDADEVAFIQRTSKEFTKTAGFGDFILQHITPCEKCKEALFAPASELYAEIISSTPDYAKSFNLERFAGVLKEVGFQYGSKRVQGKAYPVKGYYYKTI